MHAITDILGYLTLLAAPSMTRFMASPPAAPNRHSRPQQGELSTALNPCWGEKEKAAENM